ncbi:hypothetical protein UFOVP532_28 [uncultured Caudovirales phage]|uniref:Uncharacterized protein n=1 Tax=uncultured Caudovirales phage TaxID=2100421 RepID=A0A6J5MQP0_9CAUD|nr:hypothetical protein UFOVP532_28 [uncultured Caudovirales phage]
MNGTKKISKGQIADYISDTTQTALNAKQGTLTLTTTGTSGAATLVSNTLNIPQYSGGSSVQREFLRAFYPSWNFSVLSNWRSWARNTSNMLSADANLSYGTTATPTGLADANFLLVVGKTQLKKVRWSMRHCDVFSRDIEIYIRSFTFANGTVRGSETNNQVLVQQTWSIPSGSSQNGFKDDFTIASHTLDNVTGIQIAFRQTSGTVTVIQGVNLILEFE